MRWRPIRLSSEADILPTSDLPSDFDWKDHGPVTGVEGQVYGIGYVRSFVVVVVAAAAAVVVYWGRTDCSENLLLLVRYGCQHSFITLMSSSHILIPSLGAIQERVMVLMTAEMVVYVHCVRVYTQCRWDSARGRLSVPDGTGKFEKQSCSSSCQLQDLDHVALLVAYESASFARMRSDEKPERGLLLDIPAQEMCGG
ncbi:hypothetical protein AKJ16_DCAP09326 [Drosera capensis]